MNKNKLLSLARAVGDNQNKIAKFLGITPQTLSNKLRGIYPFTLEEVTLLKKRYNINNDNVVNIFLGGGDNEQ